MMARTVAIYDKLPLAIFCSFVIVSLVDDVTMFFGALGKKSTLHSIPFLSATGYIGIQGQKFGRIYGLPINDLGDSTTI